MSDPTDPGGVTKRPERARSTRVGDTGSPLATPVTIGLAILLVLGGALILRSVRDDGGGPLVGGQTPVVEDPAPLGSQPTEAPADSVAPTPTEPPAAPAPTRSGATVQVANASFQQGSAGTMTTTLAGAGYTTASATNVNREIIGAAITDSVVYYVQGDAAAQAVAQQLATDLAIPAQNVQVMPAQIPTTDGTTAGATVLMMLGTAQVGKTITPAGGTAATANAAAPAGNQTLLPPVPAGQPTG